MKFSQLIKGENMDGQNIVKFLTKATGVWGNLIKKHHIIIIIQKSVNFMRTHAL